MNAEVHSLAGAYALDALPEDERASFRAHLEECDACRSEVDEFAATSARLGLGVAETPPAGMREDVMARVAQTRQWSPLAPAGEAAPGAPRHRRRSAGWLAAAALVLVALAGGVGVGYWVAGESTQQQIAAVVGADDARTEQAQLQGGGTLTLISSAERDKAVVMADSLPELSPEQVYQLWIIDEEIRSADAFFDGSGAGQVHVLEGLESNAQIAITREPQGGSEQPSMEPLGLVAVSG